MNSAFPPGSKTAFAGIIRSVEFHSPEPGELRPPHGTVHVGNQPLKQRIVHLVQRDHQQHCYPPISEPLSAQDFP